MTTTVDKSLRFDKNPFHQLLIAEHVKIIIMLRHVVHQKVLTTIDRAPSPLACSIYDISFDET